MGFQKTTNFRGLTVPTAYSRISYIGIDKDAKRVVLQIQTHASVEARDALAPALSSEPTTIENKKDNNEYDTFVSLATALDPFAAAYTALKARPEWSDATDVEHADPVPLFGAAPTAADLGAGDAGPDAAPGSEVPSGSAAGSAGEKRSWWSRLTGWLRGKR